MERCASPWNVAARFCALRASSATHWHVRALTRARDRVILCAQAMARYLNEIEFAWSSEQPKRGTLAGEWQLFKGAKRSLLISC